jgi:hypothetical protein
MVDQLLAPAQTIKLHKYTVDVMTAETSTQLKINCNHQHRSHDLNCGTISETSKQLSNDYGHKVQ